MKEHESIRREWKQLADDQKQKANEAKTQTQQALVQLEVAMTNRGKASAELARVTEQLRLAASSRDKATEERKDAQQQRKVALADRQSALAEVSTLSDSRITLQAEVGKLTSDRDWLKVSVAAEKSTLVGVLADLSSAEEALKKIKESEKVATNNLRDAQQDWLKAFEEMKAAQKTSAEAAQAKSTAEAELALLKLKASQIAELESSKDKLDAIVGQLAQEVNWLSDKKEGLLWETSTATRELEDAKRTLAQYAGRSAAELERLRQAQKDLTASREAKAKTGAELTPLEKARSELLQDISAQQQELAALQKRLDTVREDEGSLVAIVKRLAETVRKSSKAATQPSGDSTQGRE